MVATSNPSVASFSSDRGKLRTMSMGSWEPLGSSRSTACQVMRVMMLELVSSSP